MMVAIIATGNKPLLPSSAYGLDQMIQSNACNVAADARSSVAIVLDLDITDDKIETI